MNRKVNNKVRHSTIQYIQEGLTFLFIMIVGITWLIIANV
jgi:hypothetical protein